MAHFREAEAALAESGDGVAAGKEPVMDPPGGRHHAFAGLPSTSGSAARGAPVLRPR